MSSGEQPDSSNAQAPRARLTARALLELRELLRYLNDKAVQASPPDVVDVEGRHGNPQPPAGEQHPVRKELSTDENVVVTRATAMNRQSPLLLAPALKDRP